MAFRASAKRRASALVTYDRASSDMTLFSVEARSAACWICLADSSQR